MGVCGYCTCQLGVIISVHETPEWLLELEQAGPNDGSLWARDQSDKLMRVGNFHGVSFFSDGCGFGPAASASLVNNAIASLN